jgi:hypothetical protein
MLPNDVLYIIFDFDNTYKEIWNHFITNQYIEKAYYDKYYKLALYPSISQKYVFSYSFDFPFSITNYNNVNTNYSVIQYPTYRFRFLENN